MRTHRRDPWPPPPEFELIASFGGARIVKDWSGRVGIRGGTAEEQALARAWQQQFLTQASTERRASGGPHAP